MMHRRGFGARMRGEDDLGVVATAAAITAAVTAAIAAAEQSGFFEPAKGAGLDPEPEPEEWLIPTPQCPDQSSPTGYSDIDPTDPLWIECDATPGDWGWGNHNRRCYYLKQRLELPSKMYDAYSPPYDEGPDRYFHVDKYIDGGYSNTPVWLRCTPGVPGAGGGLSLEALKAEGLQVKPAETKPVARAIAPPEALVVGTAVVGAAAGAAWLLLTVLG